MANAVVKKDPHAPLKGTECEVMPKQPSIRSVRLNSAGKEILSPLGIAPPIGYKKSPSLAEQIKIMVRSEKLRQEAEQAGYETFEEADDFDVDDELDPTSPYEPHYDPPPPDDSTDRAADKIGTAVAKHLASQLAPTEEGDERRSTQKPSSTSQISGEGGGGAEPGPHPAGPGGAPPTGRVRVREYFRRPSTKE